MWGGSEFDAPEAPQAAKTHVPVNPHEPPSSMGAEAKDGYIDYAASRGQVPQSANVVTSGSSGMLEVDRHSQRSTSTAPLRQTGAAMGTTAALGGRDRHLQPGVDDRDSTLGSDRNSLDEAIAAGMPIGLLAAIGTPYAKKPIFRSKKFKILCLLLVPISVIIANVLLIFPILRAIAKHSLATSVLHIYSSNITAPTASGFALTLGGRVKKTGIFPAKIYFRNPAQVYWINPDDMAEVHLGSLALSTLGAANGAAIINQLTYFNISDQDAFGRFTEYLVTQESFTWRLKSHGVDAKAFSFLAANGLNFQKDLTLNGFANFTNISISDFQLPGNDPQGGITQDVVTRLTNPSPFGIQMGTLGLDLFYKGVYIGPAQTVRSLNVTSGVNTIPLVGRLIDQTGNQTALDLVSELFSAYLNGDSSPVTAIGRYAELPNGDRIEWLNRGIRALQLSVPLKSPTGRISPITSIIIGNFALEFEPGKSYAPIASSTDARAGFALPFGFSLNISEVQVNMGIIENQTFIANLSTPYAASNTFILKENAAFTSGTLDLDIAAAPLIIDNSYSSHLAYSQFQSDIFTGDGSQFFLSGTTNAITSTPIGQVALRNIGFAVPAGLIGLKRLLVAPTNILSVDVTGGTSDHVNLDIQVQLTNPSNLILDVGDVTFQLFDYTDKSFLGRAVIPNLRLVPGQQTVLSKGLFQANSNPTALSILNKFTQGEDSRLLISGFNGSTPVDSLTQAFMKAHLNTTLTGLKTKLLNFAALTVLPSTGQSDNIARAVVSLENPFTSELKILNIQSNVTAKSVYVGAINQDTQFNAGGKQATNSPDLGLGLNLYPPSIFSLLRQLVVDSNMDPAPLDGIVKLGGYTYIKTTSDNGPVARTAKRSLHSFAGDQRGLYDDVVDMDDLLMGPIKGAHAPGAVTQHIPIHFAEEREQSTVSNEAGLDFGYSGADDMLLGPGRGIMQGQTFRNLDSSDNTVKSMVKRQSSGLYENFDMPTYVLSAFKSLKVKVNLVSVVQIGDFVTDLTYEQDNVPAQTDSTLALLLPVLARPIVQRLVDQAILGIDTILIQNPQLNSFTTALNGAITNAGPFDAVIEFVEGLSVYWNGDRLGQLAMPNVNLVGDVGASINLQAAFNVADVSILTEFTGYLLTQEKFTWQIAGQNLAVHALGIVVPGISISKTVQLDGFNGLKNQVTITHFDLPSNDPAGGIHLTIDTDITNPSSVGVELSSLNFQNSFGNTIIGPAAAASAFTLAPKTKISLPLVGRLVPQSSSQGLDDISTLFNGFIHGVPSDLIVTGESAGPAGVTWLNEGIKQLKVPVVFPAAQNLQVIKSITINQMALYFTEATAWSPSFTTDNTDASFQLPFAFPLDITQIANKINVVDQNTEFATLNVPLSAAQTDVVARTIHLQFKDIPFAVFSDGHNIFSQFLTDTTDGASKTFALQGSADTVASTAVGNLNIKQIPFSVSTSVLGLQGLNARPAFVTDLDVYRGLSDYLQINVNAHLFNPSNITIGAGDVGFGLVFSGQQIGIAFIPGLVLVPGENVIATQVRYQPSGSAQTAAGQELLQNFVQAVVSTTIIQGNKYTTPIGSLKQALATIALETQIPPLTQNLITRASLVFPKDILKNGGIANANFILANPFTASINLLAVRATAIYTTGNLSVGVIDVKSLTPPISAPGHTEITSPYLPLKFNLDPKVIIALIIAQASKNGVDLGPLPPLFQYILSLGTSEMDTSIVVTVLKSATSAGNAPECVSGQQFNVFGAVLASLKNLEVTLQIESTVKLDDYKTALNFNQYKVPAITDDTALYLIGAVAPPIVQRLVDQATLTVAQANVTKVTDKGFMTDLQGSLLNSGPFDAYIQFPDGLDVIFLGSKIASIQLPPICAAATTAVPKLVTTGVLTITDNDAFTDFAKYILHNEGFEWLLSTKTLRVEALGLVFDKVSISKTIAFKAFNNLPGTILQNFDLPGDGTANGGASIDLFTNAIIPSPASLGIELGTANFVASFQGNTVGPVHAENLFLAPQANTSATLTGYIQKQDSDGLQSLGVLISNYLQGKDQFLNTTGVSVISPAQPNKAVNWLSRAFKTLTISVLLPGKKYTIITAVDLANIQVSILNQQQAYNVLSSSTEVNAKYANPLHFSLQALEAGVDAIINFAGTDAAQLVLPINSTTVKSSGISTGPDVVAPLVISFDDQILKSLNNGAFDAFFAKVTDTAQAEFDLHGIADVLAKTKVGKIPISGIPFNVSSKLPGINSFGGVATIPQVPLAVGAGGGGVNSFDQIPGPDFIRITLDVLLKNPSTSSIATNQASFPIVYNNINVGRAVIANLSLVPGDNMVPSEFHFAPANKADAGANDLLTQYLQRPLYGSADNIPLSIQGDQASSPYGSLKDALGGVVLSSGFQGIGAQLVHDLQVDVGDVISLLEGYATIRFKVNNTLSTDVYVNGLVANGTKDGILYAQVNHVFDTPFLARANSISDFVPDIKRVFLPQGFLASTAILGQALDLANLIDTTIGQTNGYRVASLAYNQNQVGTSVTVARFGWKFDFASAIKGMTEPALNNLRTLCSGHGVLPSMISGAVQPLCESAGPHLNQVCSVVGTVALSYVDIASGQEVAQNVAGVASPNGGFALNAGIKSQLGTTSYSTATAVAPASCSTYNTTISTSTVATGATRQAIASTPSPTPEAVTPAVAVAAVPADPAAVVAGSMSTLTPAVMRREGHGWGHDVEF